MFGSEEPGRFVDEVRVVAAGGRGGSGSVSFRREKFRPRGGPDGGDGGDGGDVVLVASTSRASLLELKRNPHLVAANGAHGEGGNRRGADGEDLVVPVPVGTVVKDAEGRVLADLSRPGDFYVAARGGKGGKGNASLAGPDRRAPRFALKGEEGERRVLRLELKVLADVGILGFPNAGKSSLLRKVSRARPRVAGFPFTTLTPHLGVVRVGEREFVMADVPGLIPGAHAGRGLGDRFLRHVERARVFLYLVDLAAQDRDPAEDVEALRRELELYRPDLLARPGVVAANKIDLEEAGQRVGAVEARARVLGLPFFAVSALTGEGVPPLVEFLASMVEAAPPPAPEPVQIRVFPEEVGFLVEREDGAWRVKGRQVERWVRAVDLANPEALTYLQERLRRVGVERELERRGARAGDEVRIGEAVFEFYPEGPERKRPDRGGAGGAGHCTGLR